MNSNSPFVHEFLNHLEKYNFSFAPKFIRIDEEGREVLSFIEGVVPNGYIFNNQQLIQSVKILRQLHDVAAKSHLCQNQETICHNDFSPWNIIFQNELPVGIIDFDEAAPGNRIDDLAYFIWTFLELGNEKFDADSQIQKLILITKTYQLENPKNLVNAILGQQSRILKFRKKQVEQEVDLEKKEFSKNKVQSITAEIEWVKSKRKQIENLLKLNE